MRDGSYNIKQSLYVLPTKSGKKTTKRRKRKTYVTRNEKKALNLIKVPKTGWNYEDFEQLRQLWREYMIRFMKLEEDIEVIEEQNWKNFNLLLTKADYHGAEMTVVRSKNPSLVGITGTCIMDTKATFKLLCKDNKARTIPKNESVFQINVKNIEVSLFGKYFNARPAERSVRKIKTVSVLDL